MNVPKKKAFIPRLMNVDEARIYKLLATNCSKYFDANSKAPAPESGIVNSSGSEQDETRKYEFELDESELRLSQLQHQLPSNVLGTLMHFVEDASVKNADDYEIKKRKTLFKNAYYEKEELL
ncbi:hypothetical protein U1Q18_005635 [Sarracenia purpurea var. burkii]